MKSTHSFFILSLSLLSLAISGQVAEPPDTLIHLREFEIIDDKTEPLPYPDDHLVPGKMKMENLKDVGSFLRQEPNISGIRKGGTNLDPVIRGFKFSQLNIQLNNGQKIEGGCPNRMDPPASHVDIDDLREIEVIKGPYALRYGPNFGGIINMKSIRPPAGGPFRIGASGKMGFESNWNGFKQQLSLWGGSNKGFFMVTGNHKDYGHYLDGNGNEVKSAFRRYNVAAQAGLSLDEDHRIIAGFDQSYGHDLYFPTLPMDERSDDTRLLSLDYKGRLSERINHLHLKVYHSDVKHAMDNKERPFSDTVVAVSEIRAINYGYRGEAGIFTGRCQLYVGTDMEIVAKDGLRTKSFILQPTLPVLQENLWDGAWTRNFGFFAEHRKRFGNWELVSSLRVDLNSAGSDDLVRENMTGHPVYLEQNTGSSHTNFSISVGANHKISDHLSIRISAGRAERSPDISERFITLLPIGYDPYDYLGNPGLRPEANNQADVSLRYARHSAGTFTGGLFFSYVNRYISGVLVPESTVMPQTRGVLGVKQFDNVGNVWLTGFEFTYRSPENIPLKVALNAGYTYGVNPSATIFIIQEGEVKGTETRANDPLSEIPPLEASLDLFCDLLKEKLVPGVHFRAAAAQNRTSEAFEENATPGFLLADLYVKYRLHDHVILAGGVNNLFDKAYYEHLNRRIVGGAGNFYEPGRVFYVNLQFDL